MEHPDIGTKLRKCKLYFSILIEICFEYGKRMPQTRAFRLYFVALDPIPNVSALDLAVPVEHVLPHLANQLVATTALHRGACSSSSNPHLLGIEPTQLALLTGARSSVERAT